MREEGREPVPSRPLLALLEHEERMARWESVPGADRENLLEQLARLMLRTLEAGAGDEKRDAD